MDEEVVVEELFFGQWYHELHLVIFMCPIQRGYSMFLCGRRRYVDSLLLEDNLKMIFLAVEEEAVVLVIEDELFLHQF